MSDVDREAVARRIRGLLAKTTENGATEAEALAAASAARRLMDAHRLSQSDVEIEAEPVETMDVDRPSRIKLAAVDYCLHGIDAYCGVKTWFQSRWDFNLHKSVRRVRILGLKNDVEMARYLYGMVASAIKSETERFASTNAAFGTDMRQANTSFQVGMARRVNTRLIEMARELAPVAKTGSGTALVVVKNAVVNEAYNKLNLKFSGGLSGMSARDGAAYSAGRAAGDRVNLSRPIGGAAQRRLS